MHILPSQSGSDAQAPSVPSSVISSEAKEKPQPPPEGCGKDGWPGDAPLEHFFYLLWMLSICAYVGTGQRSASTIASRASTVSRADSMAAFILPGQPMVMAS